MPDERLQAALARLETSLDALADTHDQFAVRLGTAMLEMKRCLFDLDLEAIPALLSDGQNPAK